MEPELIDGHDLISTINEEFESTSMFTESYNTVPILDHL